MQNHQAQVHLDLCLICLYRKSCIYVGNARLVTKTSPEGRKSFSYLNTKDQVIKDSIPGIAATYYTYDAEGRVITTRQAGRTTTYSYDSKGRLLSTRDPIGRRDSTFYDDAGRVTRQVFANGNQVSYGYDLNGNMTSLTPPGQPAHLFSYDKDNKLIRYLPPLLNGDSTATKYIYDQEGRITRTIFADSTFIEVSYDTVDGRQRAITYDRGTTTFDYDSTSGNISRIIGASGDMLLYAYDGSLLLSEESKGLVNGKVSVSYDNNFRVINESINGVSNIATQYNRDDQPTKIGALGLRYNTTNSLLLSDTVGSVITDYGYNTVGELTSSTVKRNGSTIYSRVYTRDSLGRISALNETLQGILKRYSYRYDKAGRLAEVKLNDTTRALYSYDGNGNRISVTREAVTDSGYYDVQDRLITYRQNNDSYTKSGYLKTKYTATDSVTYSYDVQGNLLSVKLADGTLIEYIVDAKNRRVGKKVNGVVVQRLLYSGDLRPVAELDTEGQILTRFVYAEYENVPEYMVSNGETYRFVLDNLGSVHLVVNVSTGNVAQRIDYDEYGQVIYDSNPGFQPFGYSGGLYDSQTGLVRFGSRDYDGTTGRWTAKDPIGFAGMDANFYGYVGQDPINNSDPNGLWKASGHEDLTRKAMSTSVFSEWQIYKAVNANIDRDIIFNRNYSANFIR